MTKDELLSQGYKYITTSDLEIYAKLTNEDIVQYYFYDNRLNTTVGQREKISYSMLKMYSTLKDQLLFDHLNANIDICNNIWERKKII